MEGLVICGDAGVVIDPAAGQGILGAMYSGIKAAETVAACLHAPSGETAYLESYSAWFNRETNRKISLLRTYSSKNYPKGMLPYT